MFFVFLTAAIFGLCAAVPLVVSGVPDDVVAKG